MGVPVAQDRQLLLDRLIAALQFDLFILLVQDQFDQLAQRQNLPPTAQEMLPAIVCPDSPFWPTAAATADLFYGPLSVADRMDEKIRDAVPPRPPFLAYETLQADSAHRCNNVRDNLSISKKDESA
jgi:hypothetical protein